MRWWLLVGLVGLLRLAAAPAWADESAAAVESRLAETVGYLASDELEGRGVDTEGIHKAAEYLVQRFEELGISTRVFADRPLQAFTVPTGAEMGPADENRLVLVGPEPEGGAPPKRIELRLGDEFNPLAVGGSGEVEAPVVFVGYGITAKREQYDDYAGIDVKDKVVLLVRKEPQQENEKSVFNGQNTTRHALFSAKIANAFEHGAAAVILVNDSLTVRRAEAAAQRRWNESLDRLTELRTTYREAEDPSAEEFAKHRADVIEAARALTSLDEQLQGDFDTVLGLDGAGTQSSHRKLPVFFAKRSALQPAVEAALGADLAGLEDEIDQGPAPHSRTLEGWKAVCRSSVVHRKAEVSNVAAVLEGVGPLADETVVVGAHYDHLGYGGPGSLASWTRAVHNGADDNASGTAAMLEVARTLAGTQGTGPRRRIVFVAFAAEEKGLLGSRQYLRQPPFALERTVAMVNMDMVGRLNENKLIIHGTGTATEFDELIERLNAKHGFDLKKQPGGDGPSDHAAFHAKKIPVLHFFTGTHKDYHRPSDDTEKLNLEGMRRITAMVTEAVESIATTAPQYKSTPRTARRRGGDRPYFGSIPDFGSEEEGYALMGVTDGSPAERAGLREGDVIVELGGSRVGGLEDFDSALRKYGAGDKVTVRLRRDDETLEVSVTLDPPR